MLDGIFQCFLSDELKLYIGLGIGYMNLFGSKTVNIPNHGNVTATLDGGTWEGGANIGLKINFGEVFYMNAGSLVCYDFLGTIELKTSYGTTAGFLGGDNWRMIAVKPYLCIGWTITRE